MIYLCITTTSRSDWRKQLADLDELGEDTVSVFPTCLKLPEREELYKLLLASKIKHIPHVHLRDDMDEEEAKFFIDNFGTEAFTIHAAQVDNFLGWKIADKLFTEFNYSDSDFDSDRLQGVGGFCVDLCHFHRARELKTKEYELILQGVKKYKVGCNHISGICSDEDSDHFPRDCQNFDYLDDIPEELFSARLCLEVENSIAEQMKFREYISQKLKQREIL